MVRERTMRIVIVSSLLALMVSLLLAVAANAQTVTPTHGMRDTTLSVPNGSSLTSKIVANKLGKGIFMPNQLTCSNPHIPQIACRITLINLTHITFSVYVDGFFVGTLGGFGSLSINICCSIPGGSSSATHVVTIPQQNPKAKLTVYMK